MACCVIAAIAPVVAARGLVAVVRVVGLGLFPVTRVLPRELLER